MGWARIDDQLAFNDKIVSAGNSAVGAWVRMLAWSAAHLTDGNIPQQISNKLSQKRDRDRLVAVGLLVSTEGGFLITNYLKYNPSKAEVLTKREEGRNRAAQSHDRRNSSREESVKTPSSSSGEDEAKLRDAFSDPSHPIPSHPKEENRDIKISGRKGRRPRTMISPDFYPSEETIRWCAEEGIDARAMVKEFVTYWQSEDELKADWQATFRNRAMQLKGWGRAPMLPPPPPPPPKAPEIAPDALVGEEAAKHLASLRATMANAGKMPGQE